MSLQEENNIPEGRISACIASLKERFSHFINPVSAQGTRRLQIFGVVILGISFLMLAYGAIILFFDHPLPTELQDKNAKSEATQIESGSSKADTEIAWRYGIETDLDGLREALKGVQSVFEESVKARESESLTRAQELEAQFLTFETKLMERLEGQGLGNGDEALAQNQGVGFRSGQDQNKDLIQKFSLNLVETPQHKKLKTVDTTIPAGAFAKTVLLSGLDAAASMNASADPRPMLLRLIDHGTLPRKFQSDLKDCHCTAGAFGDLSSERVYARLEKLTCIDRKTGEIIETQVAGYIAGSDGKAGLRGIVASKDGQLLTRSLIGGMFAGLSNVANPQNRQMMGNPFLPGGDNIKPPSLGEQFGSGMATGASSALDRLSQYYIDRAEQLQPVIQIAAGQVVDIVFTEGTFIGSQNTREAIEKTRESARGQISQQQKGQEQ